ncbi:MAG TPA: hypothetical protein VME43_30395, partial [Bryobacteraceae bacterium]|nr:hypothetical protein [Bryobacteraceae bacterium]
MHYPTASGIWRLAVMVALGSILSAQQDVRYDWKLNPPPERVFSTELRAILAASDEHSAFESIRGQVDSDGVARPTRILPGASSSECRIEHEFGSGWRYQCVMDGTAEEQARIFENLVRLVRNSRQDWTVDTLRSAVLFRFRNLEDRTPRVQIFRNPTTLIISPAQVNVESEIKQILRSGAYIALPTPAVAGDVVPSGESLITVTNASDHRL